MGPHYVAVLSSAPLHWATRPENVRRIGRLFYAKQIAPGKICTSNLSGLNGAPLLLGYWGEMVAHASIALALSDRESAVLLLDECALVAAVVVATTLSPS